MSPPNVGLVFDRDRAKRELGWDDARIDAYLSRHPQGPPRQPQTTQRSDYQVTESRMPAGYRGSLSAPDLARQAAQGATFGFADEIEAAARAPFTDRGYREIRDEIRTNNDAYAGQNPMMALGANIAGGAGTGGLIAKGTRMMGQVPRVLSATGLAPASANAGAAVLPVRLVQAGRTGAAYGTIAGAGSANELSDVPANMARGAKYGALFGIGAGAVGELTSGAQNLSTGMARTDGPVSRAVPFIQSESPQQAGARRVSRLLGRTRMTPAQLEAASAAAPPETSIAELIPDNQGVRGLRIARNMGRERDNIDRSLTERANEEPAKWSKSLAKNTGVESPRDPKVVKTEALAAVKPRTDKLYAKAYERDPVVDGRIAEAVDLLQSLPEFGPEALRRARTIAASRSDPFPNAFRTEATPDVPSSVLGADGRPASVTKGRRSVPAATSVAHMHDLRKGLDEVLDGMEAQIETGGGSPEMYRAIGLVRDKVDQAVKRAGGKVFRKADELHAGAMSRGESFAAGARVEQANTPEEVTRMQGEARDPNAFREGAASQLQARAWNTNDGEAGMTGNPVQGALGSETRRARTAAGFAGPAETSGFGPQSAFTSARDDARQITGRLNTRRQVSGNSTTAANTAEMVDEFISNPGIAFEVITNPRGALKQYGERIGRGLGQGMNASQATEMGRILGAGLPGQMTRAEGLQILNEMQPAIRQKVLTEIARRGGAASAIAGRATTERR